MHCDPTLGELDQLSSHTHVDGISQADVTSISVSKNRIHLSGTGIVEVTLEYGGGEPRDGLTWNTDFPFTFDIELNGQLEVEEINELRVDTSSFYE